MKRNYVAIVFTVVVIFGAQAQGENEQKTQFVYNVSTPESDLELKNKSEGNRITLDKAIKLKNKYERSGVVFLSTKQMEAIKQRIASPIKNDEDIQYTIEASKKYMVITELLK